jgi:HTH-type transcriptional regulator / antitoxin HigA
MTTSDFQPDWISTPGQTIADLLDERDMSEGDLADLMGSSNEYVESLIEGRVIITRKVAESLATTLGPSATFWQNREIQYNADFARLNSVAQDQSHKEWLREIPHASLVKNGWLNSSKTSAEKVASCLRYFDVANVDAWNEKYQTAISAVAFRTSTTLSSKSGAVLAWLRQGELKSAEIHCAAWDAQKFRQLLPEMKKLTRQRDISVVLTRLQKLCAECGVALVIARTPDGCRASGATRFLTRKKAMMLLSFRHRSDDHFWFTFFHEAGHLVLHSQNALFIEDESEVTSHEEKEANQFAGDILIPPALREKLLSLKMGKREIVRFAQHAGVSPGVVVGQLQHMGRVRHDRLNGYKRRYDWSELPL